MCSFIVDIFTGFQQRKAAKRQARAQESAARAQQEAVKIQKQEAEQAQRRERQEFTRRSRERQKSRGARAPTSGSPFLTGVPGGTRSFFAST